ncbi:heparinase II/III family protein [Pirellulales bacterium]|nr:heparinase II/III family protein [Pirellulales bacterium]
MNRRLPAARYATAAWLAILHAPLVAAIGAESAEDMTTLASWHGLTLEQGSASNAREAGLLVAKKPAVIEFVAPQDWRTLDELAVDVKSPAGKLCELQWTIDFDYTDHFATAGSEIIIYPPTAHARVVVGGDQWQHVVTPLDSFRAQRDQPGMWQYVKKISLRVVASRGSATGPVLVSQFQARRRSPVELICKRPSLAAAAGNAVEYEISLINHSDRAQTVRVTTRGVTPGVMPIQISPEVVSLGPGEQRQCRVQVTVPAEAPVGGRETQTLVAVPNGAGDHVATLDLITVRRRPHPYLLLTEEGWQGVRQKIAEAPWAQRSSENIVAAAKQWTPPDFSDNANQVFDDWGRILPLMSVTVAWKISGDDDLRQKILTVVRRMLDPERGYLVKKNSVSAGGIGVHEGMFFCYFSIACDAVFDDPSLSAQDHEQLRQVLELYLEQTDGLLLGNLVYNYSTCANAGAILAALVLQDMKQLDRQLYGHGGFAYQIAAGVQDDGWHQEGATNYHVLIMRYYALAVAACDVWRINLYDARYPTDAERLIDQGTAFQGYLGMNFEKWGPVGKSSRSFRDMLVGMIPAMDHRGVVIGINDSDPIQVGDVFEYAYARERDPDFAWVIGRADRSGYRSTDDMGLTGWYHLIYGVRDVPAVPDPRAKSAVLANVGLGILRSQAAGRAPEEQITAVLKWGTQGGWHGHFDRCSLLALERYGERFYNPIAGFDGYMRDQYKMWDQASASHNMVIVDELMQEPVESERILFATHEKLQVCAAETRARWCQVPDWMKIYPPKYGPDLYKTGIRFEPDFQPVVQRRLLAVTDDYVVIADFVDAPQEHTYDWLMHPRGFRSLTAPKKEFLRHEEQAETERVSSYRYMTDCDWYRVTSPALTRWSDGPLQTDIHLVWPQKMEIMIGQRPHSRDKETTEADHRRVLLARSTGRQAQFLSIVEPYRDEPLIRAVSAMDGNQARVELTDGRVQELLIAGLDGAGQRLSVTLTETGPSGERKVVELPAP